MSIFPELDQYPKRYHPCKSWYPMSAKVYAYCGVLYPIIIEIETNMLFLFRSDKILY